MFLCKDCVHIKHRYGKKPKCMKPYGKSTNPVTGKVTFYYHTCELQRQGSGITYSTELGEVKLCGPEGRNYESKSKTN